MSDPSQSFPTRELYEKQHLHRLSNKAIQEGEIYTALSVLENTFSQHEAVAFPVRFESIDRRVLASISLATIAMNMILLDEDLFDSDFSSPGIIENGVWKIHQPLSIEKSAAPIDQGFLLLTLPDDPTMSQLNPGDPRSIF